MSCAPLDEARGEAGGLVPAGAAAAACDGHVTTRHQKMSERGPTRAAYRMHVRSQVRMCVYVQICIYVCVLLYVCVCMYKYVYICGCHVNAPLAADSRLSPPGDEAARPTPPPPHREKERRTEEVRRHMHSWSIHATHRTHAQRHAESTRE